jgi:hypothetical protein
MNYNKVGNMWREAAVTSSDIISRNIPGGVDGDL